MDAASLSALWLALAPGLSAKAHVPPPTPTPAVLAEAAKGKVGRLSLPGKGVAAYGVIAMPMAEVWLSLTDDHLSDDVAGLTEVALHGHGASPKVLYQRIDLPWPFEDRQWVLRLENNAALAAHCGAWERSWELDNSELSASRERTDPAAFDAALALPTNRGSWILYPVDATHTFSIYQAWTDLGGNIPAEAAEAYTRSSLDDFYAGLVKHIAKVKARYGPGCKPEPGADGAPIPCFP